jgi:hypothetical protein
LVVFSLAIITLMALILALIFKGIRWVLIPIGISVTGAIDIIQPKSITGLIPLISNEPKATIVVSVVNKQGFPWFLYMFWLKAK